MRWIAFMAGREHCFRMHLAIRIAQLASRLNYRNNGTPSELLCCRCFEIVPQWKLLRE